MSKETKKNLIIFFVIFGLGLFVGMGMMNDMPETVVVDNPTQVNEIKRLKEQKKELEVENKRLQSRGASNEQLQKDYDFVLKKACVYSFRLPLVVNFMVTTEEVFQTGTDLNGVIDEGIDAGLFYKSYCE